MRYRSKIGFLFLSVQLIILALAIVMIIQKLWLGFLFTLPLIVLLTHTLLTTSYVVSNGTLFVKSGVFINKKIPITSIRKIQNSSSFLSSPALSLDRLEIIYNKFDSILVSPKEKESFVKELKKLNPVIE